MPSEYKEIPITFEKGLVTEIEESLLDVGQAAELENWEPLSNGALRSRNRWSSISTDGLPTDYKVRGWGNAAVGSGGGSGLASIVQFTVDDTPSTTVSLSLSGTTAGNIIVLVITIADNSPVPGGLGAYTQRVAITDSNLANTVYIYTKTAAGGTESVTPTSTFDEFQGVWLAEISGLVAEAPTDTDTGNADSGVINLSCASSMSAGFALSVGIQADAGAWTDAPSLSGGTTQFDISNGVSAIRSTLITATFTGATVADSYDAGGGATPNAVALAIWDAAPAASTPAEFYIIVAIATATGYSLYRIARSAITTGTWELVDSEACSDTSAFVSMAVGAGELVWSSSTMTNPRHVVLSTLTGADTTDLANLAGRAVAYHKDRMFVGGSADEPSRLFFSDIGLPHSFTTVTDYLDVGGEDGEAIEDVISVEGLLLVCKVNRLYLISGSGIESFFTNELPGGTAGTGRPAVRTPYGTIVAGPADIWVVQGGGVDPMSRPLGADYSITGLVTTAYAQDTVLVADSGTGRVYRVNLVTGAWGIDSVAEGENQVGNLFSLQGRFYYGVLDSDTAVGGTRKLSDARSYDEITGGTNFVAATGRIALLGPSVKYTPRWLFLQTRNHDTDHPNVLFVDIESDHGVTTRDVQVLSETQRDRIDIPKTHSGSEWIKLTLHADSSASAGAIDPERIVLGVDVEAPR